LRSARSGPPLFGFPQEFVQVRDQAEFQFCRLAEDRLQLFGILKPWHLHHDAIIALALNAGLSCAELVDAAVEFTSID